MLENDLGTVSEVKWRDAEEYGLRILRTVNFDCTDLTIRTVAVPGL
jgi:hypothetical protein